MRDFLNNGKVWVRDNHKNILLLAGISLVGALAFESGFLRGTLSQSEPIVISLPAVSEPQAVVSGAQTEDRLSGAEQVVAQDTGGGQEKTPCTFVGSRNSDKYHLQSCAVVKRIKQENKVCFASEEDAKKRGYVAGCLK